MRHAQVMILFVLFGFVLGNGQTPRDYTVQLSVEVQSTPPRIKLLWPESLTTSYFVHRKLKSATDWGTAYATLPGDATSFTDTLVSAATSYEYRVLRTASSHSGFGYINAGIEVHEPASRGGLLLLVDSALTSPLAMEIGRLEHDLEMDGWVVFRSDLPELSVDSVKTLIRQQFVASPGFIKSVFLLGHIAVPYSGSIAPDGHPDHNGAWPADVFYGDINGIWTDEVINNEVANDPRNDNVPGDGKFDQSLLPSDVELQVGRVDFSNLPVYSVDEVTLTRNYLNRNHAFRVRQFVPDARAVVDDNFGAFGGEAFAASAYRNFAPMVGAENVSEADYRTSLAAGSYLVSYGCGGGSYTSCAGVGTSNDFAGDSLQTVFTMLFGSYFGDWDRQNNLMRVALAQGTTLAISWAGRPHWMYHHMALGETIGYSTRLTQNNSNLYSGNYGMRFIHVALLGDPTLRLRYAAPPADLTAFVLGETHVALEWQAASDSVMGYRVYRRSSPTESFSEVTTELITETQYVDSCMIDPGSYEYMVRAVELAITPSGSYYNLSTGINDTVRLSKSHAVTAGFDYMVSGDTLRITANTSINATSFHWDFGDGNFSQEEMPIHIYSAPGPYEVMLVASSTCDEHSTSQLLDILSFVEDREEVHILKVYPTPAHDEIVLVLHKPGETYQLLLSSSNGTVVRAATEVAAWPLRLDVRSLQPGVYLAQVVDSEGYISVGKVIVE